MVMDMMARAETLEKAGQRVIHLEVGEPDFDTPLCIQTAAVDAIRSGDTHYTHALGRLALREAICEHYFDSYGVNISPEQVMISTGTSPAMLTLMMALIDPGDEVILSNPGYACYPNFVFAQGGIPKMVTTSPEDGFRYRSEAINAVFSNRTKAIVINSPANPTGVVMTEQQMAEMAGFDPCYIISDEIYHGLVYEGCARSILEFTDKAFVVNGFSKRYAMTGWRLGYVIFPPAFTEVMTKLNQNFMISAGSFVQQAAIAALRQAGPDVAAMRRTYDERRRFMVRRLKALGFTIRVMPTGAFYVFADARFFCRDSYKTAVNILETAKVAVTPGIDFGTGGEGFLRFSYANNLESIEEGMDRLEAYLGGV
jgi:aspartate/methionine/tyrosine aminotransferase